MKPPAIIISDHAIIRFIERHYGLSLDPIREQITNLVKGAVGARASSHSVGEVTFCFDKSIKYKGAVVVATVLERGMKRQNWLENHKG